MGKKYRKEQKGGLITIWDDEAKIGLRFGIGETMQRYTATAIVEDKDILTTEQGVKLLEDVTDELTDYAAKHYPKEFKEIDS